MGRSRVLSFMSAFGGPPKTPSTPSPAAQQVEHESKLASSPQPFSPTKRDSPEPLKTRTDRASSRPVSMIGAYQPPLMEIAQDTIPELLPIFMFLNSHSNKLYQEGYFLKLNDLDTHGKPYTDRSWSECFAQLVGTVLSLWDAAALDAAGQDGEVAPTFINLADASIKMIETLPTRSEDGQPLANVLSISTAGKNRYLFHFSNVNALTQWTAGIRLAMYEHATLQEAYTGSLIAGKGKTLNNIKVIMDRTKMKSEEWTRVRFGAGTPWRRCWCVISPPDEKEIQKQQKSLKKKSAYDRTNPIMKGDIKFYDTRRTKKVQPIATIKDAYSAYAIYPQSKPLIDQSTLLKIEGIITIHSKPEATTEGFVFVMPEVHPAVTGFEMLLRFLFPVYDVFALYGRPNRLVADTLDTRSLMFAMPQEKRYGYLEIFDVATLIHTDGSQSWSEQEWRKQLKILTSQRIEKMRANGSRRSSLMGSSRGHRNSLPSRTAALRYEDGAPMRSTLSLHRDTGFQTPPHTGSAPPGDGPFQSPRETSRHQRAVSETLPFSVPRHQPPAVDGPSNYTPSRLSYEMSRPAEMIAPPPPVHTVPINGGYPNPQVQRHAEEFDGVNERSSSESERRFREISESTAQTETIEQGLMPLSPPAPVAAPPAFAHQPGAKPQTRPYHSPELRRANSRMSSTTLSQLAAAGNAATGEKPSGGGVATNGAAVAGAAAAWRGSYPPRDGRSSEEQSQRGVNDYSNVSKSGMPADHTFSNEGMAVAGTGDPNNDDLRKQNPPRTYGQSQSTSPDYGSYAPPVPSHGYLSPTRDTPRSVSPLSQYSTKSPAQEPQEMPANVTRNFSRYTPSPQSSPTYQPPEAAMITPSIESERPRPEPATRHKSSQSINRKPLPSAANGPEPDLLANKSVADESRQYILNEDAFDRIGTMDSQATSNYGRRLSDESSRYDTDSVVSPDYASTRPSTDTRRAAAQEDRPRTGVLKTVGTVNPLEKEVVIGDVRYRPDTATPLSDSEIPVVDFGPTQVYSPGRTEISQERSKSTDRFAPTFVPTSQYASASESYKKGISSSSRPGASHSRSPSRTLTTPEPNLYRSTSAGSDHDNQRSVAWQPGAAAVKGGSPGSRQSITPEQFVQQRAVAGRVTPVYAHTRKQSGTPPQLSRNSSGDWSAQPNQKDVPSRPHSRGASVALNNATDYSAHLSAREQEHVARVTGSPLINVPGTNQKSMHQGGGLIGAIEAREREKQEIKQGWGGQMVQHAIAQRQQNARTSQYGQPSPPMHIPGQFPRSPPASSNWGNQQYYPLQQQNQAQWMSPAAQIYWNTAPSPMLYQPAQEQPYPPTQYPPTQFAQGQNQGQNQSQTPRGQQQPYNSYFMNGQGRR